MEQAPEPAKVAAMLMLLPGTLGECPGTFRTYLWWHVLAPAGPRFAHIFVFLDRPFGAPKEEVEADGAARASLERWLASPEASKLRPCVSLLEGSAAGACCFAKGEEGREKSAMRRQQPRYYEELCAGAAMGELCAKQNLNMERALLLAEELKMDWLVCNLDADEAFVSSHRVGKVFAKTPPEVLELWILNHEAVPERGEVADFFLGCSLFKRNPYCLSSAQKKQTSFWRSKILSEGRRVVAKRTGDQQCLRGVGCDDLYFSAYWMGKSAIRVRESRALGAYPEKSQFWSVGKAAKSRLSTKDGCILHYSNCQGFAGLVRKYKARTCEHWNVMATHSLCQYMYRTGVDALEELYREALVPREEEREEIEGLVSAGVCLRITRVQEAISNMAW